MSVREEVRCQLSSRGGQLSAFARHNYPKLSLLPLASAFKEPPRPPRVATLTGLGFFF